MQDFSITSHFCDSVTCLYTPALQCSCCDSDLVFGYVCTHLTPGVARGNALLTFQFTTA